MKIPMFHGNGFDYPKQYGFLCEAFQTAKQIVDNDINKIQLETTLKGRALYWYMRFLQVPQGNTAKTMNEIQEGLFEEFKSPKSKAQYIIELKDIKEFLN